MELKNETYSLIELKKQYKIKMLIWHPDRSLHNGISEQELTIQCQKFNLAYEILAQNINLQKLKSSNFNTFDIKSNSSKVKKYYDYSIDVLDEKFINRITLKSSNVKWIDYINDVEILIVRFKKSDKYYMYYDVPIQLYNDFKLTNSPGKFVIQYLDNFKYESFNKYAEWLNIYKEISELIGDEIH